MTLFIISEQSVVIVTILFACVFVSCSVVYSLCLVSHWCEEMKTVSLVCGLGNYFKVFSVSTNEYIFFKRLVLVRKMNWCAVVMEVRFSQWKSDSWPNKRICCQISFPFGEMTCHSKIQTVCVFACLSCEVLTCCVIVRVSMIYDNPTAARPLADRQSISFIY